MTSKWHSSVDGMRSYGFAGFETVAELWENKLAHVPKARGIYAILRLKQDRPAFLTVSQGGHFKGNDPTVPVATLEQNWIEKTPVVYIGKAGGTGRSATLSTRLKDYMGYGQGKPRGHQGGRYIWQLADCADLVVCWKPIPDAEPAEVESALIREFTKDYSQRPFANLRD